MTVSGQTVSGAGKLYAVSHLSFLKLQLFLPLIHEYSWKGLEFVKSEHLNTHCSFVFRFTTGKCRVYPEGVGGM